MLLAQFSFFLYFSRVWQVKKVYRRRKKLNKYLSHCLSQKVKQEYNNSVKNVSIVCLSGFLEIPFVLKVLGSPQNSLTTAGYQIVPTPPSLTCSMCVPISRGGRKWKLLTNLCRHKLDLSKITAIIHSATGCWRPRVLTSIVTLPPSCPRVLQRNDLGCSY